MIISEKKAAAERIAKAIDDDGRPTRLEEQGIPYFEAQNDGRRVLIVPAVGHLYTIAPERRGGFHYPIFNVKWTAAFLFNKKLLHTRKWISAISKIAEGASELISGTDNDIEGEVIGYTILKYACKGKEKKAKRMIFSTLTTEELKRSYRDASPQINFKLVEAGETRHIVDFLWGINLSRALTIAVKNTGRSSATLSAGRVQAPILKCLVEREKEIQSFVPIPFWKIRGKVKLSGRVYEIEYGSQRIESEIEAKKIADKCSQRQGSITNINIKTSKENPPVPFDLGTLQTEAYRLFRYTPSLTLRLAERLYLEALISYPRTSSQKIPSAINYKKVLSALARAVEYQELVNKLLKHRKLRPKQGNKEDPAHPAIYPTGNLPKSRLNMASRRLFDLVVKRFMATFGTPAIRENTSISIQVAGETFYLHGTRLLHMGWLEFYEPYRRSKEAPLPPLSMGTEVFLNQVRCYKEHTSPPSRYNPSSLLRLMEEQNIGTKATRADIIDTLYDRAYVRNEGMIVTELGFKVVETLEKFCQGVLSVEFTRTLEVRMDNIEKGVEQKRDVLKDNVNRLRKILNEFRLNEKQIGLELLDAVRKGEMEKLVVGQCPICTTGKLVVLFSRKTKKRFVGCTNFSKGLCNATFPLPQPPYRIRGLKKSCKACSWPVISVGSKGRRYWTLCLNTDCPAKKKSAD